MLHQIIRYSVNEVAYNEGLISQDVEFVISRKHCTPIRYTRVNQESTDSSESSSSDEYESEDDLEEASIYYSETSSSDIEDLEYNPWRDYTPPPSPELEEELTSDEESEEEDNPAVYIA